MDVCWVDAWAPLMCLAIAKAQLKDVAWRVTLMAFVTASSKDAAKREPWLASATSMNSPVTLRVGALAMQKAFC